MIKNIFFILLLCSKPGFAQFTKADLQASGLTCSMCNLATQKQLQTLSFVDSIVPNLELNVFHIYFNQKQSIDFEMIKRKVEDAGFFVAELKVTYLKKAGYRFAIQYLFTENAVLNIKNFDERKEEQVFKFMDEGFVTAKAYKKYKKVISEMVLPSNTIGIGEISNIKMYHVIAE
jgi:cation transport ATPase